jgi:chromosome segregation ATPase
MNCPQCQQELRVRAEYLNRRVACKHCKHSFTITESPAAPPAASPAETPNLAPRVEALEQELRQAQAALDAAQAERRTAAQQLEQSQTELEQARQQLHQAGAAAQQRDDDLTERDRLRAAADALKDRAARADTLEKELEAERSTVTALRSELQTSQATFQSQAEATQKTLARVRGERNRAFDGVRRLLERVQKLKNVREERDRRHCDQQ